MAKYLIVNGEKTSAKEVVRKFIEDYFIEDENYEVESSRVEFLFMKLRIELSMARFREVLKKLGYNSRNIKGTWYRMGLKEKEKG